MDIDFTAEDDAFRLEVREFLEANVSPRTRAKVRAGSEVEKQDVVDWVQALHARGWSVPHWPRDWGGAGWSLLQQMIYRELVQQVGVPEAPSFGMSMVGPVIYTFGTEAQKRRFLPRIASLQDWWCQGFSEPGAGSDLASLRTTGQRDGNGDWVLNGQKTWTTLAQHADWMFVLARTDPDASRKQAGISFLLVDMRTPGVTVRPLKTIDGGHEINEVFLDNVVVPADQLVGEENKGWTYAKFLLGNERIGQARVGFTKARLQRIRALMTARPQGWSVPLRYAEFENRLLRLEVELRALEMTQLRMLTAAEGHVPPTFASVLKIKGSETLQAATELLYDVAGISALAGAGQYGEDASDADEELLAMAAASYFNNRKVSIYGGTNEIQRNIIAQAVLAA
ncbi:MAG: acyl-CoA dehydrogenase family protein [Burkholderiales bacterium]